MSQDYRYFPEPDLLTIVVGNEERVDRLKSEIPGLPNAKIMRYVKDWNLPQKEATFIAESVELASLFDSCLEKNKYPAKSYSVSISGGFGQAFKRNR